MVRAVGLSTEGLFSFCFFPLFFLGRLRPSGARSLSLPCARVHCGIVASAFAGSRATVDYWTVFVGDEEAGRAGLVVLNRLSRESGF